VRTGRGDPAEAVARTRSWMLDAEEVLDLVRWMRRYNEDPRHRHKLHFYGFDMQICPEPAQALAAYLHRVDPAFDAAPGSSSTAPQSVRDGRRRRDDGGRARPRAPRALRCARMIVPASTLAGRNGLLYKVER
jgi:erythromycin esterase-like protein